MSTLKDNYIKFTQYISKHALLSTLIMVLALGTVSASAAQLFGPENIKPFKTAKSENSSSSLSSSVSSTSSSSEVKLTTYTNANFPNLSFNYDSSWKLEEKLKFELPGEDNIYLTKNDLTIDLKFLRGIGGLSINQCSQVVQSDFRKAGDYKAFLVNTEGKSTYTYLDGNTSKFQTEAGFQELKDQAIKNAKELFNQDLKYDNSYTYCTKDGSQFLVTKSTNAADSIDKVVAIQIVLSSKNPISTSALDSSEKIISSIKLGSQAQTQSSSAFSSISSQKSVTSSTGLVNGQITLAPKNLSAFRKNVNDGTTGCGIKGIISYDTNLNDQFTSTGKSMALTNKKLNLEKDNLDGFNKTVSYLKTGNPNFYDTDFQTAFISSCGGGFGNTPYGEAIQLQYPGTNVVKTAYSLSGQGEYLQPTVSILALKDDNLIWLFGGVDTALTDPIANSCGLSTNNFDAECYETKVKADTQIKVALDKIAKDLVSIFAL